MVRRWLRLVVVLAAGVSSGPYARGGEKAPSVNSLRIVSCAPTVIKPCQRATVLMELRLEREATPEGWRRIVRRLSETVHVNGVAYRNRLGSLSGLNAVCGFGLVSHSGAGEPTAIRERVATKSALVVGMLFTNFRDRECLFLEPGDYEIDFSVDNQTATTAIVVEEPAAEEAEIVNFLNNINVLLLMHDPMEISRAPEETASELRRLAKVDSSYSKVLSLAVGIGGVTLRPLGPKPSKEEFRQRGSAWAREVYGILNPYCSAEITSPIEALGTYKCGVAAGMLAADEGDERRTEKYLARQEELWDKVANSPMAFGEATRARDNLATVRKEKAARELLRGIGNEEGDRSDP